MSLGSFAAGSVGPMDANGFDGISYIFYGIFFLFVCIIINININSSR